MTWVLNIKQSDVKKFTTLQEHFGIISDEKRKTITSQGIRSNETPSRIVTSSKFRYRRELSNGNLFDKPLPSAKSFGCSSTNFNSKLSHREHFNRHMIESVKSDILSL